MYCFELLFFVLVFFVHYIGKGLKWLDRRGYRRYRESFARGRR